MRRLSMWAALVLAVVCASLSGQEAVAMTLPGAAALPVAAEPAAIVEKAQYWYRPNRRYYRPFGSYYRPYPYVPYAYRPFYYRPYPYFYRPYGWYQPYPYSYRPYFGYRPYGWYRPYWGWRW